MKHQTTNWNKEQLSAYILLYCANADFSESKEETELILSKVQGDEYQSVRSEFEADNDFQSIQKIETTIERLGYSSAQIDDLINEMRKLFMIDGEFDAAENTLFTGLKKILKS